MKVKILLVPLFIITSVALLIWLVYPAYTNGTDGLKEKLAQLEEEKKKLVDIEEKNQHVEALAAQIASEPNKSQMLYQYIPETTREEEIIHNINTLATDGNLAVFDLMVGTVEQSGTGNALQTRLAELDDDGSSAGSGATPGEGNEAPAVPIYVPVVKSYEVKLSVVGTYEDIKTLIGKIYKLERFNKVTGIDIGRPEADGKTETGNSLEADLVFHFKVLEKFNKRKVSMDEAVFGLSTFDMKPINDVIAWKNIDMAKPSVGAVGRANPFLP